MAGLTHSNDTTGKDKKANGFRHFFNSYMSGAALAPILGANYGKDRKAYHLTADYNWGYTTEEAVRTSTEAMGWETVAAVKTPLTTDEGSKAFVKSFGEKYGFPPSQAAHTTYVQTILYADACERSGTFNPCGVGEALEDFQFDGMGNGPTLYRGEDHQCFKDVLVVKGKENPTSEFDLLEIVEVTPAAQVTYDASIFGGELGKCNPGA